MQGDFLKESKISPLPADLDSSADIPFHAAAGSVEIFGDLRVEKLADSQKIIFIRKTETNAIVQLAISPVGRADPKRTQQAFHIFFIYFSCITTL